jgi:hypothetical protein
MPTPTGRPRRAKAPPQPANLDLGLHQDFFVAEGRIIIKYSICLNLRMWRGPGRIDSALKKALKIVDGGMASMLNRHRRSGRNPGKMGKNAKNTRKIRKKKMMKVVDAR